MQCYALHLHPLPKLFIFANQFFISMSQLILTIDLGTSGPKVAVFDTNAKCIGYEFEEIPLLLYEHGGAEQRPSDWLNAIKNDNLTWTHVSDLQFWQNAVAQQFQIFSIPQNYLIDPEGKIVGKNLRGEALDRKLEKIFR